MALEHGVTRHPSMLTRPLLHCMFLLVTLLASQLQVAVALPHILQATTDSPLRLCLDSSMSEIDGPFKVEALPLLLAPDAQRLFFSIGTYGVSTPTGLCADVTNSSIWSQDSTGAFTLAADGTLPGPWDSIGWTMSLQESFDSLLSIVRNKLPDTRRLHIKGGDLGLVPVKNGDHAALVRVAEINLFSLEALQSFLKQQSATISGTQALVLLQQGATAISYILIEPSKDEGSKFKFVLFEAETRGLDKDVPTAQAIIAPIAACPNGCCVPQSDTFSCSCFC